MKKSGVEKFFGDPILNKILNFRANVHGEDIVPHKRNLDMIFFTCNSNLSEGFIKIGEKRSKSSRPSGELSLAFKFKAFSRQFQGCISETIEQIFKVSATFSESQIFISLIS